MQLGGKCAGPKMSLLRDFTVVYYVNHILLSVYTYSVRIIVAITPLVEDEKDQPSKQRHQEQYLRNELDKDVDETLEMTADMIHLQMKN